MLTAIKGLLRDRRDRREMLNMRTMLVELQKLLFPENEMTGALVRNKTGLHLTQHLESRLGIMGPDFITTVSTDLELGQEGELLDRLPPERLDQLAAELGRLAGRTLLERGNPEEWDEDFWRAHRKRRAPYRAALVIGMAQDKIHSSHKHEQGGRQGSARPPGPLLY